LAKLNSCFSFAMSILENIEILKNTKMSHRKRTHRTPLPSLERPTHFWTQSTLSKAKSVC
jgi:hypothetical protein